MSSDRIKSSGGEALSILSKNQGAIGSLVRAFLSRRSSEDKEWLDEWFSSRIKKFFVAPLSESESDPSSGLTSGEGEMTPFAQPIILTSIQVQHFRGFRESIGEIDMGGNLIVIEGKNSSGKTSLAEALEWLFSGSLSRRENIFSGNARELAHCIANRHRPPNKETWVSAVFSTLPEYGTAEAFSLRRVLQEDYGTSKNASCKSVLYFNDKALLADEEQRVLDKYFAGVPPLLMQHTLRDFVQGDPKWRRKYFERLLQLDEMTELIRSAVISGNRLTDFPSPSGGQHLDLWEQLGSSLENSASRNVFTTQIDSGRSDATKRVSDILSSISLSEFPSLLVGQNSSEKIITALREEQERALRKSFPLLAQLRPHRRVSNYPHETQPFQSIETLGQKMRSAWDQYEPALIATDALSDKNLAVSKAFKILLEAGTIQVGKDVQNCPLCAHEQRDTLSANRISTIERWHAVREAEQASRKEMLTAKNSLLAIVKSSLEDFNDLLPNFPIDADWDSAIQTAGDQLREEAGELRRLLERQLNELTSFVIRGRKLIETSSQIPSSKGECESLIEDVTDVALGLAELPSMAKAYCDALASLEDTIGMEASMDSGYRLRDCILLCYNSDSSIADDLRWEHAKRLARQELEMVRESLIMYRQEFLENRRMKFNDGIESVWKSLRDERYSAFSHLHIPKSRGVGFPIELELKALIDDSNEQLEVDALSVFSESQVNALGIAAFVTRSMMLGHRILVFDDPVQSMDEEHFFTFARNLIPDILNGGNQVVLLTHNDAFARGISYHNHDFPGYVTMKTVHRRKTGSVVEEGNRTIPERLKTAERKLDEGDYGSAWTYVRLAIERLYTVTYMKYGSAKFDPFSWRNHSAEDMWERGVKEIVSDKQPNGASRLREILSMTAAGSHDKAPMGETEIRESLKFLRRLTHELKVGR